MEFGEKRIVIRFATFPVLINRQWIWWKYYQKYQICKIIYIEGQRIAPFWTEEEYSSLIWSTYKKELI